MKDWLKWAVELQFIGQIELAYGRDVYDIERFERIRQISAEIMSVYTELEIEKVKEVFCNETGYQTPKLDTRAAIFQGDKILLVKEKLTRKWSLPGGWVDVNLSIKENTIKEVQEEAGLNVTCEKIISIMDRNKHNTPIYAHGICKIFVQCKNIGGEFKENIETEESDYFSLDELPPLAEEKNTK